MDIPLSTSGFNLFATCRHRSSHLMRYTSVSLPTLLRVEETYPSSDPMQNTQSNELRPLLFIHDVY